ncbi:MAG: type II toxin-antitoxin system HicB family antitoxin [Spirochaetaceae bacterium]|nr:type II toxin-antitoxin system HicB family antitoxin [Spirochaetaceae bacterium]
MMTYKGFIGSVEYDDEAHVFSGEVINTRTVITFQGTTVDEIENAFHDSVDDYLEWCKEDGIEPEKPYSGKFNVRLTPLFHSQVAIAARKMNMSLNSFVEKSLHDEIAAMKM